MWYGVAEGGSPTARFSRLNCGWGKPRLIASKLSLYVGDGGLVFATGVQHLQPKDSALKPTTARYEVTHRRVLPIASLALVAVSKPASSVYIPGSGGIVSKHVLV